MACNVSESTLQSERILTSLVANNQKAAIRVRPFDRGRTQYALQCPLHLTMTSFQLWKFERLTILIALPHRAIWTHLYQIMGITRVFECGHHSDALQLTTRELNLEGTCLPLSLHD